MKFKDGKSYDENNELMDIILGNRYTASKYNSDGDPTNYKEVDDGDTTVFQKDDLSYSSTSKTAFSPISQSNYDDGTKVAKNSSKIITAEDSGLVRDEEIKSVDAEVNDTLKATDVVSSVSDGSSPVYMSIIESGISGEKYSETNEYSSSSDDSSYNTGINDTLLNGITDVGKTLAGMGTSLLQNSYTGSLVDAYASISSALGDTSTQDALNSVYGVGDSGNNNYEKDSGLLNIQSLKNGVSKTAAVTKSDLTPYLNAGTINRMFIKGDNRMSGTSDGTISQAVENAWTGSNLNAMFEASASEDPTKKNGVSANVKIGQYSNEDYTKILTATKGTILTNKPGKTLDVPNYKFISETKNSEGKTTQKGDGALLSARGDLGVTIKRDDSGDLKPYYRSAGELINIAAIKAKNDYIKHLGYLYVEPFYSSEDCMTFFSIPFEFNPTINEGSITAKYAAEDLMNRRLQLRTYIGSDSSEVQIETTYMVLSPSSSTDVYDTGKNFATDAWQYYYTPERIRQIELQYRSLIEPLTTGTNGSGIVKPPLVEICMNSQSDKPSSNDKVSDLMSYPLKTKTKASYEGSELVITRTYDTNYDVDTNYLKVTRSLQSLDSSKLRIGMSIPLTLKKYIVTSVSISPLETIPYTVPSRYKYSSDVLSDNDTQRKTESTLYNHLDTATESSTSTYGRYGFKVSMTLAETTKNLLDIVPDYKAYYNAWNADKTTADTSEVISESGASTLFWTISNLLNDPDKLTSTIASLQVALNKNTSKLSEVTTELSEAEQKEADASTAYKEAKEKEDTITDIVNKLKETSVYVTAKSNINTYINLKAEMDNKIQYYDNLISECNSDLNSKKSTLNQIESSITGTPTEDTKEEIESIKKDLNTIDEEIIDTEKEYEDYLESTKAKLSEYYNLITTNLYKLGKQEEYEAYIENGGTELISETKANYFIQDTNNLDNTIEEVIDESIDDTTTKMDEYYTAKAEAEGYLKSKTSLQNEISNASDLIDSANNGSINALELT